MANNKKFAVKNGLLTQNVDFVSPNETHTLQLSMLDTDTLSISGNSGQLFSITDSQSGTIFAVNDVSGVTSIEVLDTGTIRLAETFGNVAIGKSTPGDKLDVEGNVRIGVTNSDATLTTNGTGDLVLSTNAGTNSGTIRINDGASGNIILTPNGTGDVQLDADTVRIGDINATATLTTNGTGDLVLSTNSGTNSGTITIANGVNTNITLAPNGTGDVNLDADTVRIGDANAAATLTTNGTGNLTIRTGSTNSGTVLINQGDNANIEVQPHGTGDLVVNEAGGDVDVRMEGDTEVNLFFLDASTDRIGLGISTPDTRLHIANGAVKRSGNISSASWTTSGVALLLDSATFTDTSSAASSTVSGIRAANSLLAPTYASTNSITVANGATLYVENPVSGTNTTISNRYGIYNAGNQYIAGSLTVLGDAVFLSQSVSLNGKQVVLGNLVAETGINSTSISGAANPSTGVFTATLNGVDKLLAVGQILTKTSGTGAFGTNTRVTAVSGAIGAYTVTVRADTAFTNSSGPIVLSSSTATDFSADGGGLVLKGTTDKSILWIDSTDYWTFNQGIETTGRIKTGNFIQDGTITATLSNTNQTSVDSTATSTTKSIKYIIEATYGSAYHHSEVMVVTDGTNAFLTEYASLFTSANALVNYDADVNSGNVRLLATAAAATTTLKILKTYIV